MAQIEQRTGYPTQSHSEACACPRELSDHPESNSVYIHLARLARLLVHLALAYGLPFSNS